MILSTLGCFWEKVPKVLVEISSFLFSKNTGSSIVARTSEVSLEHLRATLFSFLRVSNYSLVTLWVIGTENKCL